MTANFRPFPKPQKGEVLLFFFSFFIAAPLAPQAQPHLLWVISYPEAQEVGSEQVLRKNRQSLFTPLPERGTGGLEGALWGPHSVPKVSTELGQRAPSQRHWRASHQRLPG